MDAARARLAPRIKAIGNNTTTVFIQADKWVDDKLVTMFEGPWDYDKTKGALLWNSQCRLWLLNVNASTMEGTSTLRDGVLFAV